MRPQQKSLALPLILLSPATTTEHASRKHPDRAHFLYCGIVCYERKVEAMWVSPKRLLLRTNSLAGQSWCPFLPIHAASAGDNNFDCQALHQILQLLYRNLCMVPSNHIQLQAIHMRLSAQPVQYMVWLMYRQQDLKREPRLSHTSRHYTKPYTMLQTNLLRPDYSVPQLGCAGVAVEE